MLEKTDRKKTTKYVDSAASLSRLFSSSVICDLAETGHSKLMTSILKETELEVIIDKNKRLKECFDDFYKLVSKHYRSEYIYKNTIAKNILLGRHSVNSSSMLTEFRLSSSKADVLILNGTSHAYEIKTELDNLDRLPKQILDYKKAVDYINVITTSSYANKVESSVSEDIGILVLNNRGNISTLRRPLSNKKNVDPGVIFDSLRKEEYLSIIKKSGTKLPEIPNTLIYKECRKIFLEFDPVYCHDMMLKYLKKRSLNKKLPAFVLSLPDSLKSIAYSVGLTESGKRRFLKVLDMRVGELI